jgi:predicted DNA-binding transcriptional regulator YafY
MRQVLNRAMQQADQLVVCMDYVDSKGTKTTRVVSPIRFLGKDRFLGLCLCRCEPRQFQMTRCRNIELKSANDYVMPVPLAN